MSRFRGPRWLVLLLLVLAAGCNRNRSATNPLAQNPLIPGTNSLAGQPRSLFPNGLNPNPVADEQARLAQQLADLSRRQAELARQQTATLAQERLRQQEALLRQQQDLLAQRPRTPGLTNQGAASGNATNLPTTLSADVAERYAALLRERDRRLSDLEADNRDLYRQVAEAKQQWQQSSDQLALVKKQLADSARQVQQLTAANQQNSQQYKSLLASTTKPQPQFSQATIKANNSLLGSSSDFPIQGVNVRNDGGVIRVELPSDQLFQAGTASISSSGMLLLDKVAQVIQQRYPRQYISIEGHTDSQLMTGGLTGHRLSGDQAQAVLNHFTSRGSLREDQLNYAAWGANHPIATGESAIQRARNRRIELVIMPESR